MAQPQNKDCCYLCDTLLTPNSKDKPVGIQLEVQTSLIATVKRCLPNINTYQIDLICQSCLNDIAYFNKVRTKWEDNESIIKKKRDHGQFKGLKDIVKPKKTSSHICRLCFKETLTQDVTFVYHEDQVYQTGYVQKMLSSHSPHTDLSLTENPIICHECLDTMQTFDAFHQMWFQAQTTKGQYTKRVVRETQNDGNSQGDSSGNNIHVQLRKTSANTVSVRTLTQEESAVSSLPNVKDLLKNKTNKIITAWASKDFLNLIQNQTSKVKVNKAEDDVCVISDDEEEETQNIQGDMTPGKMISDTDQELIEIIPLKKNMSCSELSNEKHLAAGTESNLADSSSYEKKIDYVDLSSVKTFEDSDARISLEINMSQVKNYLESEIRAPVTQKLNKTVDPRKKMVKSIDTVLMSKNGTFHKNDSTLEVNVAEFDEDVELIDGTLMEAGRFTFVEVDDSDSQNSEDIEVLPFSLPRIEKINYFNENFKCGTSMVEINMVEDEKLLHSEVNAVESIHSVLDAGFSVMNDDSTQEQAEITPSIEINMSRVNELFQTKTVHTDEILEINSEESTSPKDDISPTIEINMSKVNEMFKNRIDNSTTKTNKLEQNLSSFLQFNKNVITQHDIKEGDELLDFQDREIGLTKSIYRGPDVKRKRIQGSVFMKTVQDIKNIPADKMSFTSAFEEFLQKGKTCNVDIGSTDQNKLHMDLGPVKQNNTSNEKNKITESTSEIIISDDDNIDCIEDEYCKWFPYEQYILDKSQGKLFNKTKKVDATVLENRSGARLYRCNNCLLAVQKESDLFSHGCVKGRGKMWFSCKAKKCNFSTHKQIQLSQHELFHKLDESSWKKCNFCEFHATEENLIVHHHKLCHQMGIVQRKSKCPHCFFESDIPDILSHHISARHGPDKGKQQNNDCNYQPHNKISKLNNKSFRSFYRCNYCSFGSFDKDHLRNHSKNVHSNYLID